MTTSTKVPPLDHFNLFAIRWVVGKCHVSEPCKVVADKVCARYNWGTMPDGARFRKAVRAFVYRVHRANRLQYRRVMGGM